jgi:hypothetical protein
LQLQLQLQRGLFDQVSSTLKHFDMAASSR